MKHRPFGFTLLELLVVVAITALLMGILLPVLGRARDAARAAVCGSNIRQLHLANAAYAHDNREHFALAARDIWFPNLERWHGKRAAVADRFEPAQSDMADYFGPDGRVKACPGFVEGHDYQPGFEDGCGGYGYNASYLGGRNDLHGTSPQAAARSARTADVVTPVATVMFTDAAYLIGGDFTKAAYSFCEPPFWQLSPGPPSTMRPNPTIDFRHLGQANVAWVDGHVGREDLAFSVDYLTHSYVTGEDAERQGVGWFGPEDNSLFDLQ
ncbi:MAG: prepilin-type N-terminal cleavage/methylation domain-containing protein [Planctomycetota bacterium]